MKIHDNTDEPKVNGYILGNQNHVGFYFNGYVYYFGFSAYKAYPRKTHLQNWCKKWVYLNEMCAEKKEEYMETMGGISDIEPEVFSNGTCYFPNGKQEIKVLAICDYDHFVELTEKVKGLEKDVENLTNNYKLLESKQAVDIAHGQALVDEFGDYEAVYQEIIRLKREVDKGDMIIGKLLNEGKAATEKNKQLRQLLKECKEYLSDVDTYFTKNADEATLLLTKINEVLK